uniref:PDZ domain-containing protein n=1 Tax=Parascaris equorum TaxID=6256 RepID=A0A914S319_PAREQ
MVVGKRNSSSKEELALNVLALHTELMQHAKVSVVLPSGTVLNINEPADNTKAILEKVCHELGLCPEKYCIVREGRHRVRLMECEYRIEKTDRSLGLTICARQVDDVIKAEVRAVRDGTTMVQVGDTVVSVDEHPISELRTADQVETLLRSATALVLRRRNCSHLCGSSFIANDSRLPVANKTHSMDRISEPSSSNMFNNLRYAHVFSEEKGSELEDSLIRISALFVNKCSKFKIYSEYSAAYLRFQQNKKEKNDIEVKLEKMNARVYRILPIAEIEVNESDGNSTQSQFLFVLIHIGSPREPVYHLCCCQAEVKNQFIKSIRKAAASLAFVSTSIMAMIPVGNPSLRRIPVAVANFRVWLLRQSQASTEVSSF